MKTHIAAIALLALSPAVFAEDHIPAETVRVRAFIDKEDILHVQGDKVWFTHVIGAHPGQWGVDWPTYVNDVPWKPNWDNEPKSDVFRIGDLNHSLPMDRLGADRISVFLMDDNAEASVLEYPDEANAWTLSIRLDNTRVRRALWMDLEISWREGPSGKMKRIETAIENAVPPPGPIVPPTMPSPTPVGRR